MTVLMWILGGAGLWVVASAILSFVMGRLIGRAQSERDSYDELRRSRSAPSAAPASGVAAVPGPETTPIRLAVPRQRAAPPAPAMPRIPQPRLRGAGDERPASRG